MYVLSNIFQIEQNRVEEKESDINFLFEDLVSKEFDFKINCWR